MNVRTTFVALAALVLAGASQSASAQDATAPATEAPQATLTAQVTPATVVPEVTPAAVVPTSATVTSSDRRRCRWQRAQREGIENVLVPLDLAREALSALRRGTTASCPAARSGQ